MFAAAEHPLLDELRGLNLDETAPRAAWEWLEQWKLRLNDGHG